MKFSSLLSAALVASLPSTPAAQIVSTVGPAVAPLGGYVAITISNQGPAQISIGEACPFIVRRASDNALVYDNLCPMFAPIDLDQGEQATFQWDQLDSNWNPVPADDYLVYVEQPDGTLPAFPLTIAPVDAGLAFLGPAVVGTSHDLLLSAPALGGATYLALASRTTSGISTCGGVVPLAVDGLFLDSLNSASSVFQNFFGTLVTGVGYSREPFVHIPNMPGLVGQSVSFAFVTLDFSQSCKLTAISAAETVVLQ